MNYITVIVNIKIIKKKKNWKKNKLIPIFKEKKIIFMAMGVNTTCNCNCLEVKRKVQWSEKALLKLSYRIQGNKTVHGKVIFKFHIVKFEKKIFRDWEKVSDN